MLAALLVAVLAIPGLVAAALLIGRANRRAVQRRPGVFRCVVRITPSGPLCIRGPKPSRRRYYAVWVHDVLVIYVGLALHRVLSLPASGVDSRLVRVRPAEVVGVGRESVSLSVRLRDRSIVRLIAPVSAVGLIPGPYVAAALPPILVDRNGAR